MADFVTESLYDKTFEGMNKTVSERIKEYIVRALRKGYPLDRIMNYVSRKGKTDMKQAETIARTETQALQNKVREWAYKTVDPEEKLLYYWLSVSDHRRTRLCKTITERTINGVKLDTLRKILKEEVENAKARGELPADYEPREWTPHFSCRSSFLRKFD